MNHFGGTHWGMKTVPDRKHLMDRNGAWYYKRRVPEHLQAKLGKKIIQFSLDTRSIKEAQKRRNAYDVRYDMEFEQTVQATDAKLSATSFSDRLGLYLNGLFKTFEKRLINDGPDDRQQIHEMIAEKEIDLAILGDPADPRRHQWVQKALTAIIGESSVEGLTDQEAKESVRRSMLQSLHREIALLRDDVREMHVANTTGTNAPETRVTFEELANEYLSDEKDKAERNKVRQQWIEKLTQQTEALKEFIGASTLVSAIDYDSCRSIQQMVADVPAHREKRYRGMSVQAAIVEARKSNAQTLSHATQAEYLRTFKAIMDLGVAKRLIPNNPGASLEPIKREMRAPHQKRAPLSHSQLAAFFNSTFYQLWKQGNQGSYKKKDRDWRFWLPLLMTFSGMRPGEVCQLQISDLKRSKGGIWFLDVTETDDDDEGNKEKKLKTTYSKRTIPLHPALVEIGFPDFVENQRKAVGLSARIFGQLEKSKRGYFSDYPCRRFREKFLPEALTLASDQSFYSFRHTFRDALRQIEAPSDVVAALGGWSEGTKVSDAYGNSRDPDYLYKTIERIGYPDLVLDFKFATD